MTRHVWITQLLDKDRHCIVAALAEADSQEDAEARIAAPLLRQVDAAIERGIMNPWCALCGSARDSWRVETRRARWRTLAEAEADPQLERLRAGNDLARALYGDTHRQRPN